MIHRERGIAEHFERLLRHHGIWNIGAELLEFGERFSVLGQGVMCGGGPIERVISQQRVGFRALEPLQRQRVIALIEVEIAESERSAHPHHAGGFPERDGTQPLVRRAWFLFKFAAQLVQIFCGNTCGFRRPSARRGRGGYSENSERDDAH